MNLLIMRKRNKNLIGNGKTINAQEVSLVEYKKPNFIQKLLSKIARLFKK